jgi:REP element-mobilizing transposase RayT
MSTYTRILYQIVFSTRHREKTLTENKREALYKHISGIIKNKNCHLYRIGGIEDHIHILTDLHPTLSLSNFVKDIKMSSTEYIKREKLFNHFGGWQEGYGAFTYSIKDKDRLIEYIKNQKEHHFEMESKQELIKMLTENEVIYNEKYLF